MKLNERKSATEQTERDKLDDPALYRRQDIKRIKTKQRDAKRGA